MKKTQRIKKTQLNPWRFLLIVILVYMFGATASFFYFKTKLAFHSPFIEDMESQRLKIEAQKDKNDSLRLYKSWASNVPDSNNTSHKESLLVTAEDIIKKYMDLYEVNVLDLYMDKKGTIYADFGDELRKKFSGDAFEEYQIIAGLYRRIKVNVPDFKSLKILIDGKETESFGGHIDISEPIGEAIEHSYGGNIESTI